MGAYHDFGGKYFKMKTFYVFLEYKSLPFFLYRCVQLTINKKSKRHKQEQQSFILVLKHVISHLFKIIRL